jgi:hypothetical protein
MSASLLDINPNTLVDAMRRLGYPVYLGDYNLNLIGIRSKALHANTFNDVLVVLYTLNNRQHLHCFPMTTDPGTYYRENPINVDGTAILVPGHYPGCWRLGKHRGQYSALVQCADMTVYRDNDRDAKLDTDVPTQSGLFGINLHRARSGGLSKSVDRWSAGCQVVANSLDFDLLMALVRKSVSLYGAYFSYTLLTEDQLCSP